MHALSSIRVSHQHLCKPPSLCALRGQGLPQLVETSTSAEPPLFSCEKKAGSEERARASSLDAREMSQACTVE
eukprot:15397680-Alexandrium_andersonii.AAC.1